MNNTGPKPELRDPKDYPKAGDIILPPLDEIKEIARKRAEQTMSLKTPPGEKKSSWVVKEESMAETLPKLDQIVEAEVFGEPTKENKQWVLTAMGFIPKGPARWWHPILGEDFEHNWLLFDLETDDLKSLTPKLYRTGWVYGQRDLRWKFKQLLDIKL